MKRRLAAVPLAAVPLAAVLLTACSPAYAQWMVHQPDPDPMDDSTSAVAATLRIPSLTPLEFPYNDLTAFMFWSCGGPGGVFSKPAPSLANGRHITGEIYDYTVRIRWDDNPVETVVISSNYLANGWTVPEDQFDFRRRLATHATVTIEFPWQGGARSIFQWDLTGAALAIGEVAKTCQ